MSAACARTLVSDVGAAVLNVTWTPPRKSMPRLRPRVASEIALIASTTPEIANHRLRRRMKSICSQRPFCEPPAPMKFALLNQRKPASRPSIARVAATAVSSEITVPISSISAKPFTCAVATANSTSAVIAVTTLASRIVWKPFP